MDISVIKNGKVMIQNAQVGGHRTYLQSLDVRTLGIAGGSMIRVSGGKIVDVGPRSAHIAGKAYECFADPGELKDAQVLFISPREGDAAEYAIVRGAAGSFPLRWRGRPTCSATCRKATMRTPGSKARNWRGTLWARIWECPESRRPAR